MSQQELFEVAEFLIEILDIEINEEMVDPTEPIIIIKALTKLFPDKAEVWEELQQQMGMEQQWNAIIEFIQMYILNDTKLPIDDLGIEQILQLYELVAQYTEQKMQEQQKLAQQGHLLKQKQKVKDMDKDKNAKKANRSGEKNKKQSKPKSININTKDVIKKAPQLESHPKTNPAKKKMQQPKQIIKKDSVKKQTKRQSKSNPFVSNQPNNNNQRQSKRAKKQSPKTKQIPTQKIKTSKQIKQAEPMQNQLIKKIAETIQKPLHDKNKSKKSNTMMRDTKTTELVQKAKRQFQYFLKQLKRQGRIKHKLNAKLQERQQAKQKGLVDQYYLKVLKKKQKNIEEMVVSQKLKYFMSLRDKKIAYITQIHKLTQKLQKQRQIQWGKQQKQLIQEQKQKVNNRIQESNNLFSKNMELLKQTYKQNKQKTELHQYNEKKICDEMQKCMKKKKLQELEEVRMLWQQQNLKLNNIMGDEVKMKQKLIKLYQKNCP